MISSEEELEFALSQYLDGTLSSNAVAAVEERLAVDAGTRELLRQYRQLNATLATGLPPMPAVDFDAFHAQAAAGRRSVNDGVSMGVPSVGGRWAIGKLVGTAGISAAWRRPLALAACTLIAVTTVAVLVGRPHRAAAIANVIGPQVEQASGPIFAEVSIGPAPSVASSGRLNHEDAVDHPSIVLIDRADSPAPDSDSIY